VNGISPHQGSYVQTGIAVTIVLYVSADTDHVVVYDGRTGEEVAQVTGERSPWTYVWTSAAGTASPNFRPVSATGETGALIETKYGFDDQPPIIDGLLFEVPAVAQYPVKDRVASAGTMIVVSREDTWVTSTRWSVDGVVVEWFGSLNWSYPPRSTPYVVHVQETDAAGNVGERTFSLTVDAKGPTVTALTPLLNGIRLRGSVVRSSLQASDESGVYRVELVGADALFYPPYAASLPTGKDGPLRLTWRVQDTVGNVTVVRRTVNVDNTKPQATFMKAPKNTAKVQGIVEVMAAADDKSGVARVQLLVNGKVIATDTTAAPHFSVDTTKYGKTLKVQLRAYDKAGNVATTATRTWYR
jgi:hypothetical protein